MQNVPKIVRERLKAATPAVEHPDADALTAFSERSLPERERGVVLEHLARCGDCRDIVALALPATEEVQTVVRPSPSGWLTWPALRWAFVAAGVVAIASVGVLKYQRSTRPSMMAYKSSEPQAAVKEAMNRPPALPAAQAAEKQEEKREEKREKIQTSAAPAFTDAIDVTNAVPEKDKKSVARVPAPPPPVLTPQAVGVTGGARGADLALRQLPHGPMQSNQWQQQNLAQNQVPAPAPPAAFAKQQAGGATSANMRVPAPNQTVEASGQAAPLDTQASHMDASLVVPSATPQPSADERISRAKLPGQIGGYVVDPSGAVVANARITITPSTPGGTPATALTNAQGVWVIAGLPTGNYKATAEAQGFTTAALDLNYDANHPSMYGFRLSVGSVAETVAVSGQNALVQTENTSIGGPLPNVQGRNLTQLAAVSSGPLPRWAINPAGALQRSFDQGATWQDVDVNANPSSYAGQSLDVISKPSRAKVKAADKALKQGAGPLTFRALAAAGAEVWAGGSGGALYHSMDAGNHWTRVVPASDGAMLTGDIVSVEFPDTQHGKLATSTAEIWVTGDNGQTWQKQ